MRYHCSSDEKRRATTSPVSIILSRGAAMEQAATLPEETWQPVVCRLCAHRFEVLITCPEDAKITLCQFCTILVEWFGQREEAHLTAQPPLTLVEQAPSGPPVLQAKPH